MVEFVERSLATPGDMHTLQDMESTKAGLSGLNWFLGYADFPAVDRLDFLERDDMVAIWFAERVTVHELSDEPSRVWYFSRDTFADPLLDFEIVCHFYSLCLNAGVIQPGRVPDAVIDRLKNGPSAIR